MMEKKEPIFGDRQDDSFRETVEYVIRTGNDYTITEFLQPVAVVVKYEKYKMMVEELDGQ